MSNSFATPWTVARQTPLHMGLPRQEYWNGLSLPSPGIFLAQGWNLHSCIGSGFFPTEPPGKPLLYMHLYIYMECISLAISANGNLYMYLYMRSLYIYISIQTYLHKLFYILHWQRNCCFYSIQITLEHFLKKIVCWQRDSNKGKRNNWM